MSKKLSHTDNKGKARMVNVGNKPVQERTAIAEGFIELSQETLKLIEDNNIKKGDVLAVARIAGIQAAKKTSDLIPLCHLLALNSVEIEEKIYPKGIKVTSVVKSTGKTGVEMEAIIAVSTSLITIYDMCKAVDKNMVIGEIKLISKTKE